MLKRLFFLSFVVLVVGLAAPRGVLGITADIRITSGTDDAEQHLGDNRIETGSTDIEIPYEDAGTPAVDEQVTGMRFPNILVSKGGPVSVAYVEIEVDAVNKVGSAAPVNVIIEGELSPNAAPFTSTTGNITARPVTAAKVKWSITPWTAANEKFRSPDISSVIGEITSQSDWAIGNALVLIIRDDKDNPSTGLREAESFEGEAGAAPLLHIEAVIKGAYQPTPANEAIEVDTVTLEWLGEGASVTYKVYLGADPNLGEANLVGETPATLQLVNLTPGTTYYWRVDQIEAGGAVNPGTVWSFTTLPLEAHFPSPADAATGVAIDAKLGWVPGKGAILHDVYFGTDQTAVAASDPSTFKGKLMTPSFDPGVLASFTTYYWKVDEFAGPVTNAGPVWSFTTVDYYVIVNDQMTLNYNNTAAPFYSELVLDAPADLTFEGVANLVLRFQGAAANSVEPLYVALEDSTGASAVVTHPDAAATQIGQWWKWKIPLAAFSDAGVNLTAAARLHIGVGNRLSPTAGASGTILIDDVLVVKPVVISEPADVTAPGDNLKGVPNDGDWPAAETPPLAIDNNANTKFLHFKGEIQPTGFQVSPSAGASIVTGLTFTTANDAAERDPVAFELYGSNVSIDGPYELIAADQIVDFNQPTVWPRFTKNTTAISFTNSVEYEHYQVLFPRVRTAASANSMQIAEVELIGTVGAVAKPKILWVSFHGADDAPSTDAATAGFTQAPDKGYTDLLTANGYDVTRFVTTGAPDVNVVNAADLVIISRSVDSGHYSNAAATTWNGVSAPMIIVNGYTLRNSRMGYTTGGTMVDITGDITLTVNDPNHPIFAGIPLTDGTMTNPYAGIVAYPTDGTTLARGISINNNPANAEGKVLATVSAASNGPAGGMVIAEWQAGATLTHSGGAGTDVLAGHRLVILTGTREASGKDSETAGLYDLYPDGAQMFLNAVAYMLQ
jgi:hypothetical protein